MEKKNPAFHSLLEEIGLCKYYPQKLSIQDAIQIREDTLIANDESQDPSKYSSLYPFFVLQKILAFDSKCRIPCNKAVSAEGSKKREPEDKSDSESDESENGDLIHPMDGLLALIHCCDNFLRQDIFSRMATCQIAVPLLLPDPYTGELTIPIWAMRSIVKEFELPGGKEFWCRIVEYPTPIVSFLKIGSLSISKSDLINKTMSKAGNEPFFCSNCSAAKIIVDGLVEISWYMPGDGLFNMPIGFTNLRGDAKNHDLEKQVDFLCSVSSVNVVLLSSDVFEDATKEAALHLLQKLSSDKAQGKSILVYTNKETKNTISEFIGETEKFKFLKYERSLSDTLRKKLFKILSSNSIGVSLFSATCHSEISLDEHDGKCVKGRELMEQIYLILKDCKYSPKDLLPLQSPELWHIWADLDKEQYRQRHKHVLPQEGERKWIQDLSTNEYRDIIRRDKEEMRKCQYDEVKKQKGEGKTAPLLLQSFINALKIDDTMVLWYFMRWLSIELENLSQLTLPPLYAKQLEIKKKLSESQGKGDEKAQMECLNKLRESVKRIIDASFGVEHLIREVGQMYEAVAEHEDVTKPECIVKHLPEIAAQMLHDGFILELLDGNAAHMPIKWISAVLKSLAELLKGEGKNDPQIYVMSVLGIQSTGKSTLLNTVFGTRFNVSAGRCTCGAFMQLIPVHPSLYEKAGVQYFLLIDTEGLRAPELESVAGFEHDNELATFVIGIADLTLINVNGSVAGDIDDILNVAVHAFMRMSEVNLKPTAHIVHQNMTAVAAKSKLMQGRIMTMEKLDKMTRAAAKETDLDHKYKCFSDVIQFDNYKDVSEFVGLWNGELPMAQVSTGYSRQAQQLKLDIINKCIQSRSRNTIPVLLTHLHKLWNAIIQEDFVFTFQNIYEIVAYKALEVKFSDCAFKFMTDMNIQQQAAENELYGCVPCQLDAILTKHTELLEKSALEGLKKYEQEMMDFFKDDPMMLKWKFDIERRLSLLCKELQSSAKEYCMQAHQAKKDCIEIDAERETLIISIQQNVRELIKQIGHNNYTQEELTRIFDETWVGWISSMQIKPFKILDIPAVVGNCIVQSFPGQEKYIRPKLMDEGLKHTEFVVIAKHIKGKTAKFQKMFNLFSKSHALQKAQRHTDKTFVEVQNYLKSISTSQRNFSKSLVMDLLQIVKRRKEIMSQDFDFTYIYEVDVAITACSKAVPVFEEMIAIFRRKHDPHVLIENEMKPIFRLTFIQMVNKVEYEKTAAQTLCRQLKEPIEKCVLQSLSSLIFKEMISSHGWTKDKQTFIGKILLEMGEQLNKEIGEKPKERDGFELCIEFITNFRESLEYWAKHFTEQHCESHSPDISAMAKEELNKTINFLIEKLQHTSCATSQPGNVNIREWLQSFHCLVTEKIQVSLIDLNVIQDGELSNLSFFTDKIKDELERLRNKLCQNITYEETIGRESAHEMVVKRVAGCTKQCPFCGAPCEHSDHTKVVPHSTHHRPQALRKYRWIEDESPILDVCTNLVSTICNFRNADTNGKHHLYKKYKQIYPDWLIPADKSFEASLYWKWFIAQYSTRIKDLFHFKKIEIPEGWKKLNWMTVRQWLLTEYKIPN